MKKLIAMTITIALAVAGAATSIVSTTHAATLYWGAGTGDIAPPDPIEVTGGTGAGGNGDWNTTIQNWATATDGTTFQAWNNANNDIAQFSHGANNTATSGTITLPSDITVGGMTHVNAGTGDYLILV